MVYPILLDLYERLLTTLSDLYVIAVLDLADALQQQFPKLLTDSETLYSWFTLTM